MGAASCSCYVVRPILQSRVPQARAVATHLPTRRAIMLLAGVRVSPTRCVSACGGAARRLFASGSLPLDRSCAVAVSTTHQNGGNVMMFLTTEELQKRTEPGRAQMPAQLFQDLGEGKPGHVAMLYNGRTPAERWHCERLVLASIGPAADVTEDILRSATHACVTALRACNHTLNHHHRLISRQASDRLLVMFSGGGVTEGVIRPPVLETTWDAGEGITADSGCAIPFSRCVEVVTTTALLSNYSFDKYLTAPAAERSKPPLADLKVHISEELHSVCTHPQPAPL